ncbi:MAG: DNA-binding transcriptional ArsR family regulator [Myxococcota bacterium]|jgi:DNA-binding transcriptional ArsR family regulator
MPRSLAIRELAELLTVLGHPDRIRIVEELRSEERDVGSLAELLEVSPSRVSQQLSVLRAHHVVQRRREGRHVYYHLEKPALAAWLIDGLQFLETERGSLHASIRDAQQEFKS